MKGINTWKIIYNYFQVRGWCYLLQNVSIWGLFDYQIIVSIISIVIAWKWGDWKKWHVYYPTMLYFVVVDFLYALLTYNYPLWEYESPILKTTFSDILISFAFVPATLLVYLPHFPRIHKKQISYVFVWVIVYTLVEQISYCLGFFSYHNGWTIWWSMLFNCFMFPLIYLHHKKPLWAWSLTFLCCIIGLIYWKIPINLMK